MISGNDYNYMIYAVYKKKDLDTDYKTLFRYMVLQRPLKCRFSVDLSLNMLLHFGHSLCSTIWLLMTYSLNEVKHCSEKNDP
jgi:hypothetical protein